MSFTFQFRRGTAAQAVTANIVLAAGEIGVETDTRKLKIGDGTTPWTGLDYVAAEVAATFFSSISVAGQSDIVADTGSDGFTLVAGTNITITTNPATNAITINSTGGGGGGSSLAIADEGSTLTAAATSINFTGAGVSATNSGAAVTVNIPGSGGGGSAGIQTYIFDPPNKTGTIDYTETLEAVIRQANGLATDGTGTIIESPSYVYIAPGRYLIRYLNPTASTAVSTTTNSGTGVNGNNTVILTNGAAFPTGSNNVGKLYTNQGVYEGRYSRTAGSNTVTFTPGQTGRSLAGLTWSVGARFEAVGRGLSILLKAEPNSATFVYYCNESAIFNTAAATNQSQDTVAQVVRSIEIGNALDYFPSGDDTIVSVLNVADATGLNPGDICVITAGNPLPYNDNDRVGEAFRIMNVDLSGNIYLHGVLEYHDYYEAFGATQIRINKVSQSVKGDLEGLNFEGAPTLLGIDTFNPNQTALNADGSPNNVLGPTRPCTITVSGTTATVTTEVAHGLIPTVSSPRVDGNRIFIQGADQAGFNIYALVTSAPTATTFTYTVTSGLTNPGGTITWRTVADCHSGISEGRTLTLNHIPYLRVTNCEAKNPWAAFIRNAYCPYTVIQNCGYTNASNALSSTDAKARLGYGVYCYGWSVGTVVDGGTWIGGRHLLTTAAPSISTYSTAEWVRQGQPTDVTVMNTVSIDAYGIPYDTHEEASLTTFKNVIAINPARGHDGGSYAGAGAHLRGRRSRIFDYYQKGGTQGIRYVGDAEGRVVAEAKPRPTTALRPTTLTWPLTTATVPVWRAASFASSGTVYIEQQPGTGTYIQCTYTGRDNNNNLTGVTSSGGTGSLASGAWVRQANVASITVSGTTATVTTTANHGYIIGQADVIIRIRGADQTGYNRTAVATITGNTTFTYTLTTTDDNSVTVTVPTVSATGNFITWQDWSQYPTHTFQNVTIEDLRSRDDSTQAIWLENSTNALKTEVRGSGLTIRNVPRGITVGAQTRLHLADIKASRVKVSMIETSTNAYVNIRKAYLDTSVNVGATTIPFNFAGVGTQIHVGEFELVFGRTATNSANPNPASIFNSGSTGTYAYSLGRLKLRDYYNTTLTSTTCPTIIPVTTSSTFVFSGGGEVLRLHCHDNVITNASKTISQTPHIGRFLIARSLAITDTAAVGDISINVLRDGASVYGTNKIAITAGTSTSATATQPSLTATTSLINTDASLTVTAVSTSAGETAKLNAVALLGYFVG